MSEKKNIQRLMASVHETLTESGLNYMTETKEVLTDDFAFGQLVESLCEGLSEEEAVGFTQLAENSRNEFLVEANTSASLNAFAPMQMMLLRTIYPRLIASRAVETRTMDAPVEIFGWLKSFIRDHNGNRTDVSEIDSEFTKGIDLSQTVTLPAQGLSLFDAVPNSKHTDYNTAVDRNIRIESAIVNVNGEAVTVEKLQAKPTIDGAFYVTFEAENTAGDTVDVVLVGNVNREKGILDLTSLVNGTGSVTSVNIKARTSQEDNQTVLSIENEYVKDTIEVGDGEIIHSSIPFSYLKDMQALWNMDAMAEATAVIGSTFSQVSDLRVLGDLYDIVEDLPENHVSWDPDFDPQKGISRIDHNLGLLERINHAVAICDEKTQFSGNVTFTILANPVDAAYVSSTNITNGIFNGKIAQGGVVRNYTEGSMTTTNGAATVLSSKLVRRGAMLIVPRSDVENELVYSKFDYSQVVLSHAQGYVNPDNPMVTNVAMLNRETRRGFRTHGVTQVTIA